MLESLLVKSVNRFQSKEPSLGLFDRIILAIKQEKEFRQTKKILFAFVFLFLVSLAVMPFSFSFFVSQWNSSGVFYFIDSALSNVSLFSSLWQDFVLSILEALPVMGIALFAVNIALLLFSVRLFLHKKRLLVRYLRYNLI